MCRIFERIAKWAGGHVISKARIVKFACSDSELPSGFLYRDVPALAAEHTRMRSFACMSVASGPPRAQRVQDSEKVAEPELQIGERHPLQLGACAASAGVALECAGCMNCAGLCSRVWV